MGSRRIALTSGVIAGGLLATAFLPMAIALADDASESSIFDPLLQEFFGFQRDASQPTTVYSVSGEPPFYQSIHQTEFFGTDPTSTLPAGSFQVDNEVITDPFGPASAELLVTSSEGGSAPPVGSVYDVINIGGGFENVYSDIAPTTPGGADTLSDTLVTPFGDIPLTTNLHAYLDPTDSFFLYDATDPLTHMTDPSAVGSVDDITNASAFFNQFFGDFYGFTQDASQPITVSDIAAIPPIYQSVHQTEFFDTNPTATLPAGWFEAGNNVLANTTGPSFSELVVTNSEQGTSAPPVGTVYEINNIGNGFENLYSDIAPTTPGSADTLSDTLVTPLGNVPLMTDLHAYLDDTTYSFFGFQATDPLAIDFAANTPGFDPSQPFAYFGFSHDASQPSTVTGVSGEPPTFSSVHLNEFFDTNPTDTLPAGSFQADSNVVTNATGVANYELLVTSSEGGSAPPVGSVYDVINIGGGFENFYFDIAPTTAGGPDTLADTLVTPFGDIPIMADFPSFLSPMDLFFPY
jgi:hypothetical protein